MADQMKNLLIGIFVIAATAIMIYVLMFIHPSVGDNEKTLRVRFSNIDKVNVGTRVTLAGKPVGEVVEIREVEFGRTGRADSRGELYMYELDLMVDSAVNIYNTDEISLMTSGLLGERSIEITPFAPRPGQGLMIIDDEVIYARETTTLEDTLEDLKEVAQKIGDTLDTITVSVNKIQDEKVIEEIAKTAKNMRSITAALNKPKELSQTIDNVHYFTASLNQSWEKVDRSLADVNEITSRGRCLVEDISSGRGFLGKILTNDDLYLRLTSILNKGETIFDDINHYGLFFSTNKGWQRLRARRLNLLQNLCTPQQFRNYFNDELDMIMSALSRVSQIMENCFNPSCCDLLQNEEFTKVFSELLRRVSMMEEQLQLYNSQVVEQQVTETELINDDCPPWQ